MVLLTVVGCPKLLRIYGTTYCGWVPQITENLWYYLLWLGAPNYSEFTVLLTVVGCPKLLRIYGTTYCGWVSQITENLRYYLLWLGAPNY